MDTSGLPVDKGTERRCEMTGQIYPSARAEGVHRQAEVLDVLSARRATYVLWGRRALLTRLLKEGSATADDVYDAVNLPPDIDARCFGAVPVLLARDGIIRRRGFATSARPERHGSYIAMWELADRAAAVRWLSENPGQIDPAPSPENLEFPFDEKTPPAATGDA